MSYTQHFINKIPVFPQMDIERFFVSFEGTNAGNYIGKDFLYPNNYSLFRADKNLFTDPSIEDLTYISDVIGKGLNYNNEPNPPPLSKRKMLCLTIIKNIAISFNQKKFESKLSSL